jgi:hypothetical protein
MSQNPSTQHVRLASLLLAILLAAQAVRAAATPTGANANTAATDDFALAISMDSSEASGIATASIRVHATQETLWNILTSCAEALQIVPGLKLCAVEETAPDLSWQRIRQVMDYSWFTPRVSYQVRASYNRPGGIVFERVAGDLIRLRGSWGLTRDGDYTVAHYTLDFEPGFWMPRWFVRAALKRDLPRMLRALRAHAEAAQKG